VKVIFAPAAKLDLFAIGEHIGPDNPKRAEIFVEELIDHCYTLADMRRRYPLVPRYEHWGIRRCARELPDLLPPACGQGGAPP
jgi:toxin ParE1/3/4